MRQKPKKSLYYNQLQRVDSSHSNKVTFLENGQLRHGVFEEITKSSEALPLKMRVAHSFYERLFQGNRSTEKRLVFNSDVSLAGTVSFSADDLKSFNCAEVAISSTPTCIDENIFAFFIDPSLFTKLATSLKDYEHIFEACLKILLTYQPTMVIHHLFELFGEMPFDYTSLEQATREYHENKYPKLFNSETNRSPFVDIIKRIYAKQYDDLFRVVVFYMGCDKNQYRISVPPTYHTLNQKALYYEIRQWVVKQNKTLYANDAKELKFNEDELEHRYHQIWMTAFAPAMKELMSSTYSLINQVLEMASPYRTLRVISSKSNTDASLSCINDYFGNFQEISLDEVTFTLEAKLQIGLLLLGEFYNKLNGICKSYFSKEYKELQVEDNLFFCQQLNELFEKYHFEIPRHLAFDAEAARTFNTIVSQLYCLKSQINFCSHLETARNQFFSEQLLTNIKKLALEKGITEFTFSSINLSVEIDEKRLNRFIELLEKQNSPIADLACGLLLEGRIETTVDILTNCNAYDNYMEKRTHDAITFYTKAARDLKINPIVEFLLWDMKMTTQCISIQERLAQYDLTPQGASFLSSYHESKKRSAVVLPLVRGLGLFKADDNMKATTEYTQKHAKALN